MGGPSGERRPARVFDESRERTILINQTLLAGVALVGILTAMAVGQVDDTAPFLVGASLLCVAAAAAAGVLPAVDILAIGFLRVGAPEAGVSLLWAFPAMWIGATFGIRGVVGATASISGTLWVITALHPSSSFSAATLLLPLTVGALSTLAHLAARRAGAQRELLEKQSAHLQHSVDRARRQEDLVTEVLDAVDFGVIRITPDGEMVVTNEAHGRLQGASDFSSHMPAFGPDGVTPLPADDRPVMRARRGDTFENELIWYGVPGDRRRALTVTARKLIDLDGSDAGSIVVSRDVTAEELALRAREDLVASVSHELRTPLTSIVGYLDLALDRPDLPAEVRRDLRVAERNAGRLLELVADILAMSTLSRQGVELTLRRVDTDLSVVVRTAVEEIVARAAERDIRIDTTGVTAAVARVDAHRVRQIVDNLLSNAVKYGRHGGRIDVTVEQVGEYTCIVVSDDGPGIPDGEQMYVFERFFRSDTVRNSGTHGSGLGLAISREIARAHGGDILARSESGEGATFTVRLPVGAREEVEV